MGADGHQGGGRDAGELVPGDFGVDRAVLVGDGELHLEDVPLRPPDEGAGLLPGLGAEPGVDVQLDGGVEVAGLQERALALAPGPQLRARLHAGHAGAEQGEGRDPLGVAGGELQGDLAAEGGADDGGAVGAEVVEQVPDVLRVGVRGVDRGLAEATEVAADDTVPRLGERGELRVPHPAVADPGVQQDDGRGAGTGQVMRERHPRDPRRREGRGPPLSLPPPPTPPSPLEHVQEEVYSQGHQLLNAFKGGWGMDLTVVAYIVYLLISVALTIWVARTLSRNGRIFLADVLHGNEKLAEAVNHLLVVGFYLVNFGFVALYLSQDDAVLDARALFEALSVKLGVVLLVLGVMHLGNVYVLNKIRRRGVMEREQVPPVGPQGWTTPPKAGPWAPPAPQQG